MTGVFEDIQAFDDGARIAHRQAVAVAAKRVSDQIGPFIKSASDQGDREARLALVQDDLRQIIADVAAEQEYEGDLEDLQDTITESLGFAGEGVTDINAELESAPSAVGTKALASTDEEDDEADEDEETSDGPFEGAAPPFGKKAEADRDGGGAVETVDLPTANDAGDLGPVSGPELNKSEWTGLDPVDTETSGTPHPTVQQDVSDEADHGGTWADQGKDRLDQTDAVTEDQELPTAGDDAQSTKRNIEQPHTDTWSGTEGLADPVTASVKEALTAQDFRLLADAISSSPAEDKQGLAEHFAHYLAGTNPNFDVQRFVAAAIGEPQSGRDVQKSVDLPPYQASDPDKNPLRDYLNESQVDSAIAEYEGE